MFPTSVPLPLAGGGTSKLSVGVGTIVGVAVGGTNVAVAGTNVEVGCGDAVVVLSGIGGNVGCAPQAN